MNLKPLKIILLLPLFVLCTGCPLVFHQFGYQNQMITSPSTTIIYSKTKKKIAVINNLVYESVSTFSEKRVSNIIISINIITTKPFKVAYNGCESKVHLDSSVCCKRQTFSVEDIKTKNSSTTYNYELYIEPELSKKYFTGSVDLGTITFTNKQTKETIKKNIHIKIKGIKHS